MTNEQQLAEVRRLVAEWDGAEGHDRCWYYPDVFRKIAAVVGVELRDRPVLPPRKEFRNFCQRFEGEQFGTQQSKERD